MAKFCSLIFGLPAAIVVIALAIANRGTVRFSLDPTSDTTPLISFELPLYVLLLAAILFGIIIGGVSSWVSQSKWRKAAKDTRHEISQIRSETVALKRKSGGALAPGNR